MLCVERKLIFELIKRAWRGAGEGQSVLSSALIILTYECSRGWGGGKREWERGWTGYSYTSMDMATFLLLSSWVAAAAVAAVASWQVALQICSWTCNVHLAVRTEAGVGERGWGCHRRCQYWLRQRAAAAAAAFFPRSVSILAMRCEYF